jgi:hypothetical protein
MVRTTLILLLSFFFCLELSHFDVPQFNAKRISEKQMKCLIDNAFYEANTEGKLGRQQVTQVVFNRTNDGNYCKTIYKPQQFSWTSIKRLKGVPEKLRSVLKEEILLIHYGVETVPFREATHYHTVDVKPVWRKSLKIAGVYKRHIFYV